MGSYEVVTLHDNLLGGTLDAEGCTASVRIGCIGSTVVFGIWTGGEGIQESYRVVGVLEDAMHP